MEKYPFEYTNYWCMIVIIGMILLTLVTIIPLDRLGLCDCNENCAKQSDGLYLCNMCRDSNAPSCYEKLVSIKRCCEMKSGE